MANKKKLKTTKKNVSKKVGKSASQKTKKQVAISGALKDVPKTPNPAKNTPLPFFHPASLIATFFGIGKIPFAPGTFGSLAGMAIIYVVMFHIGEYVEVILLSFAALCFGLGLWACKPYTAALGVHDHGSIVIDEVVGQILALITFMVGPYIFRTMTTPIYGLDQLEWLMVTVMVIFIMLFLTFRLFDIWKPWIIRRVQDNMQTPMGIMLDDVLAGIAAGLTCAAMYLFFMVVLIPWIGKPVL